MSWVEKATANRQKMLETHRQFGKQRLDYDVPEDGDYPALLEDVKFFQSNDGTKFGWKMIAPVRSPELNDGAPIPGGKLVMLTEEHGDVQFSIIAGDLERLGVIDNGEVFINQIMDLAGQTSLTDVQTYLLGLNEQMEEKIGSQLTLHIKAGKDGRGQNVYINKCESAN